MEENGRHINSEARRGGGQPMVKSWLGSFDALLREADRTWGDGWHPCPPRANDLDLLKVTSELEANQSLSQLEAEGVRAGIVDRDIRWLSQLATPDGKWLESWELISGWEWVRALATALGMWQPSRENAAAPLAGRLGK